MTAQEIHDRIVKNNKTIESLYRPDSFILDEKITELLQENIQLQDQCPHEYVDGYCRFCYCPGVLDN